VKRLTLDTNCLIDLAEGGVTEPALRSLIRASQDGRTTLQVPAISASERGAMPASFDEFRRWLAELGLGRAEILKPVGYWGVTYWGWAYYPSEEMTALERKLHDVLFPRIEFDYSNHDAPLEGKWRNAKCDVLALWSHIHHGGDIFVTSDANFRKPTKKPKLLELGAGELLTPTEAAARITQANALA